MHSDNNDPFDSFSRRLKNELEQVRTVSRRRQGQDDQPLDSLAGRLQDALQPRRAAPDIGCPPAWPAGPFTD